MTEGHGRSSGKDTSFGSRELKCLVSHRVYSGPLISNLQSLRTHHETQHIYLRCTCDVVDMNGPCKARTLPILVVYKARLPCDLFAGRHLESRFKTLRRSLDSTLAVMQPVESLAMRWLFRTMAWVDAHFHNP